VYEIRIQLAYLQIVYEVFFVSERLCEVICDIYLTVNMDVVDSS
jgi:hypothetical protein